MTRSRTITGTLCLVAICAPVVIAPFRLAQSLAFVHDMENRNPNEFPSVQQSSDLLDSRWWSKVSVAFEDRVPFRKEIVSLNRAIFPGAMTGQVSDDVEIGIDNWLFLRKSINQDLGTIEETHAAIDAMESFLNTYQSRADLSILVAPNKVTIYPEKLKPESQAEYAKSAPQRELMHTWFATTPHTQVLDIWTPMLDAKANSTEQIFESGGSHYNSIGAMVLAKEMINATDPTLWEDNEIVSLWTKDQMCDIAKLVGDWNLTETITRLQVKREGVELVELWDDQTRIARPDFLSIEKIPYEHPIHVINRSDTRKLIPGKTMIILDSYVALYLLPTFSQFFEDVQFVHFKTMTPEYFRESLNTYDRVYFQTAERHLVPRAIMFFDSQFVGSDESP